MSAGSRKNRPRPAPRLITAAVMVLLGSITLGLHLASILRDSTLARNLISDGLWKRIATAFGATLFQDGNRFAAEFDAIWLIAVIATFAYCTWGLGGLVLARIRRISPRQALYAWGFYGWMWWLLPFVWEFLDVAAGVLGLNGVTSLLRGTLPLWHGALWAGWLTTGFSLGRAAEARWEGPRLGSIPATVWLAVTAYAVLFTGLNGGLYASLMLPHGDSAMYEEHLWNLLHGKGFRSYLDNGRLFLGEHVQVIHLLLIPLYFLWPSHLLLETSQSVALAAGALPLYRIALRHGGSTRAATALAIAYLLYVPLQSLDIAIDFKTFRPNGFEIPFFLWAFDALECRRWKTFGVALALALLCQEDAATIIAPLGAWIAFRAGALLRSPDYSGNAGPTDAAIEPIRVRNLRIGGACLAASGTVYVLLVIKVVLPYFRGGADVHFAQYFTELGDSSGSITAAVFQHPGLVLRRWLDPESISFALALLAPLGFLSFLAPGRLAIAAPLFGVLCLSEITNSAQHHFHAPLVPVIFWAAASGLGAVPGISAKLRQIVQTVWPALVPKEDRPQIPPERFAPNGRQLPCTVARSTAPPLRRTTRDLLAVERAARWAMFCSAAMGIFLGLSPAAISFWDPDSSAYWKKMYVPGERARQLPALLAQLPADGRIASTDFIHPRLTHFERSYDYSDYRPIVPDDADYIVIDTRHPYSQIHDPRQIKELRDEPDKWELLPDETKGYFIVLRRKR